MKFAKKKPKQATAMVASAPAPIASLAALSARAQQLELRSREVTAEILRLEQAGVRTPETSIDETGDAIRLLAGEDTPPPALAEPEQRLTRLYIEASTIRKALALADQKSKQLAIAEETARWVLHKEDYDTAMRRIVGAVVELEHAQRERDAVASLIKASWVLPGQQWPFAGRTRTIDSQARKFLGVAVEQGWLTEEDYKNELA